MSSLALFFTLTSFTLTPFWFFKHIHSNSSFYVCERLWAPSKSWAFSKSSKWTFNHVPYICHGMVLVYGFWPFVQFFSSMRFQQCFFPLIFFYFAFHITLGLTYGCITFEVAHLLACPNPLMGFIQLLNENLQYTTSSIASIQFQEFYLNPWLPRPKKESGIDIKIKCE